MYADRIYVQYMVLMSTPLHVRQAREEKADDKN